ncbi:hypothetical protein M413DRAFT_26159 [Hebeloma cylindrosporum]|uniref:F-box domain-containing protein n=1 Tax=Hebeloma cylindrosporum TaxID=76867 RepID=A0A0C3C4T1_HEBCY|nr:hypothetical protein M413DRAFT_26159 [Hebeloma cylindrosporum h7]
MSSIQPTSLPFEIYGLIVDCLAEDEKNYIAVRACSTVSSAFLPLTRKHIFSSVWIEDQPTMDAFMTLILCNPEIVQYVRKLEHVISNFDDLQQILGKLTNLKSLVIRSYTLGMFGCIEWVDEEIDFAEPVIYWRELLTSPIPPKPVFLKDYTTFRECASTSKKLAESQHPNGLPIIDFTELATITVNCADQEDIDAVQSILIRAIQLQNLHLRMFDSFTYSNTRLAEMIIRSIRTLKTLKLAFYIVEESSEIVLSHLCQDLQTISGDNIIESLSISILVNPGSNLAKGGNEWGLLDKVLTKKDAWFRLKQVSVEIQVPTCLQIDDIIAALNNLPDNHFKGLSTSETISFKLAVTRNPNY